MLWLSPDGSRNPVIKNVQHIRQQLTHLTLKRPPGVKSDPSVFFPITFLAYLTMTPTFVTLSRQVSSMSALWFCAVGDNRFSKISIFPTWGQI